MQCLYTRTIHGWYKPSGSGLSTRVSALEVCIHRTELEPSGDGVLLEAEFVYDPSGNIPPWVTVKTQIPTSVLMMNELREAAVTATRGMDVE